MQIYLIDNCVFYLFQNHPVTDIYVEIQSRHIELYSAVLHIHAHFTGLRYLMFHWPVLSAIVGISSNLFFIVLVCLLSWLRLYQMNEGDEDTSSYVYEKLDGAEKNKIFVFKGENDGEYEGWYLWPLHQPISYLSVSKIEIEDL